MHTIFKKFAHLETTYRMKANFKEKYFELLIFDPRNVKAWNSKISEDVLTESSRHLGIEFKEYYDKLITFLEESQESVEYHFHDKHFTVIVSLDNDVKVKFFQTTLNEVDYGECADDLLEKFYNQKVTFESELMIIKAQSTKFKKSLTECQQKLDDLHKQKGEEKDKLLGAFVTLINEKKRRIQHLTEILDAFRTMPDLIDERDQFHENENIGNKRKRGEHVQPAKPISKREEVSESEEEYDTDEEKSKSKSTSNPTNTESQNSLSNGTNAYHNGINGHHILDDDSPPQSFKLPPRSRSKPLTLEHTTSNETTAVTSSDTLHIDDETTKEVPKKKNKKTANAIEIESQDWLDLL